MGLGFAHEAVLEARVGDAQQALHAFGVGGAAQVGHAVLGDDDIAQVARDGAVGVAPHDVGVQAGRVVVRGAQRQHRAGAGQRVRLRDEVVLPAHAGDDAAVGQRVGRRGAQQRHLHRRVDEPGVAPLRALERLGRIGAVVQLVDEGDAGHRDVGQLGIAHVPQPLVERARAEEEAAVHRGRAAPGGAQHAGGQQVHVVGAAQALAVQAAAVQPQRGVQQAQALPVRQRGGRELRGQRAVGQQRLHGGQAGRAGQAAGVGQALQGQVGVDAATDEAGVQQLQQAVGEHLGAAVQPLLEAAGVAPGQRRGAAQRVDERAELAVALLAQQQRLGDGVAQRADADLQRAAVGHQAGGVQADGVVGLGHGRVGRREQRVVALGRVDDEVEEVLAHLGRAGHEGQLLVQHGHHQQRLAQCAALVDKVGRQVGVARQRVALLPTRLAAHGHRLGQHVGALGQHVAHGQAVVAADEALLRGVVAEVVGRLDEELAQLDVGRQRLRAGGLHVGEVRVVAEHAGHQRREEVALQVAGAGGLFQRQRGQDAQRPRRVGRHAVVQRIDQRVGLADAQRQRQVDGAVHAGQQGVDGGVEVGQQQAHGASLADRHGPGLDVAQRAARSVASVWASAASGRSWWHSSCSSWRRQAGPWSPGSAGQPGQTRSQR